MGLFDRFKKRVKDVVDETDERALSVAAASKEGQAALQQEPVAAEQ